MGTAMPAPLPVNEAPAIVAMKKADAKTGPMKPIDWAMTSLSVSCPLPRVSYVGSVPISLLLCRVAQRYGLARLTAIPRRR